MKHTLFHNKHRIMAKTVRAKLPIRSVDSTLELCKGIIEQHQALGAGSPLTNFVDMADFEAKTTLALQKRKTAEQLIDKRQAKFNLAQKLCGMAKGQTTNTENTILWHVLMVRNTLLVKHKGAEEMLSEYGFKVVIGQRRGRKTVRMAIPYRNAEKLIALAKDILEHHAELGAGSPLTGMVNIAELATLTSESDTLLKEWAHDFAASQSLNNVALVIIGYAPGQTSYTEGTLYYHLCMVRDCLLTAHKGTEETLSEYGFNVVIRSRRYGRRGKEK
jgi:hypothetical protein